MDRISKKQRSRNMTAVKSRGNLSTEVALAKIFRKAGIAGWKRNQKILGIRPDFIFPKRKLAVFVHGCFWHGCKWHGSIPKTNRAFWKKKIIANKDRDKFVRNRLKLAHWKVVLIWEHSL